MRHALNARINPWARFAFLLFGVGLFVGDLSGQSATRSPDLGVHWSASNSFAPLEIEGIVIDVSTGLGLRGAQIQLTGTDIRVLTDQDGRFRMSVPSAGQYEIVFQRLGFWSISSDIEVQAGKGVGLQIATERRSIHNCPLTVCTRPECGAGVRVEVKALDTGVAPARVELTVTAGGRSASALGVAPASDSAYVRERSFMAPEHAAAADLRRALQAGQLHAGGELATLGPFDVMVSAPGYATWDASQVWLRDRGPCDPPASSVVRVWLIPL